MKNINVRTEESFKKKVEEVAKKQGKSVTEFVIESLKHAVDPRITPLHLPEITAAEVRQEAANENMDFDEFVERVLRIYLQEPWSVWKSTPTTCDKRSKLGPVEIMREGQKLVREMLRRGKKDKGAREICATLPQALHFSTKANFEDSTSWRSLYDFILSQLGPISVRRLVIHVGKDPRPESPFQDRKTKSDNFEMRKVSVEKIMGGLATASDRYCLNDFNVYGDVGVIYTDETSRGLPIKATLSRAERDIQDWKSRFEELWKLASTYEDNSGEEDEAATEQ